MPREIGWAVRVYRRGISHCRLITLDDERIGWAFGIEREGGIELEELFVKPQFRRRGFGTKLLDAFRELAVANGATLKVWVSFADMEPANLDIIRKLIKPSGFTLEQTDVRWAAYLVSGAEAHGPNGGHRSSLPPSRPRAPFSPEGL